MKSIYVIHYPVVQMHYVMMVNAHVYPSTKVILISNVALNVY